ncbi:hypothetical protein H9Q72_013913 [Fusarium xylarioides]|uniref:F-box domain-containing protein n=1 Tax=Fusarium xylarioides TaxID=221167 RepID=A0A9P7HL48_9HYPO|nr:hypothetical protein H9Q72_013913 [Fusarium xylarioides]
MDSSSLNTNTDATACLLVAAFALIALELRKRQKASLGTLPGELKQMIARFVDPIGLISLRQTNRHFRRLIQVQERQYIERLLALECVPEHGGPPALFTHWHQDPAWYDRNLPDTRWACTGCMRLRPYYRFQHKFLSEVIWRKPIHGSPGTNVVTSWEPTQRAMAGAAQPTPSADDGRSIQARYEAIVGDVFQHPPWSPLALNHIQQLGDITGLTVRKLRRMIRYNPEKLHRLLRLSMTTMENSGVFGSDRYFRKCIECQYKSHVFNDATIASDNDLYGTERFPIISIGNYSIASPLDRYFPGVLEILQQGRPRAHFYDGYPKLWPIWVARCPPCAKWKELRSFRIGAGGLPGRELESWEPAIGRVTWDGVILTQDVFKKGCCNECFIRQNTRIALSEYLVRWFQFLVEQQPDDVQGELLDEPDKFIEYGLLRNHPRATTWS